MLARGRRLSTGKKCLHTVSLKDSLCSLFIGAMSVGGGMAVYYQWGFFFNLFSLSFLKNIKWFFFLSIFQLQFLFFWILVVVLNFFVKVLFVFNFIILSYFVIYIYFFISYLFFWFSIFFLDPFIKVLLVSISSFNSSL